MSIPFGKDGSNLLHLSNGTEIIKINPGSIIKLNGKEGRFTGFDVQKRVAGFSTLGSDNIEYFNLEEIKKIQILKEGWVVSNMIDQAGVGFKKGIDVSKILSFFSVYFIYDRENNDRVEITNMEKKYISALMVTPIIGGLIGGVIGAISPKPIYKLSIFLNENSWKILL
tara:strand:+ start:245 stop:751 length:507 start_codon:yes stop_codon:yes gene_type:complete